MQDFDDTTASDAWHDDKIEITDLDMPRNTRNKPALAIGQSLRFSAKIRLWLALFTVVAGLLLLFIILRPSLPSSFPANIHTTKTPAANASGTSPGQLATEGGIAYFNGQDGTVYALKSNDGSILWQYKPPLQVSIKVADKIVYLLSPDITAGFVIALRASDGALLWHQNVPNPGSMPLTISNGTVYVSTLDGFSIDALSTLDGSPRWQFAASQLAPYPASFASLQIVDGIVYLLSEDNLLYVVRASDGYHLWSRFYQPNELGFGLPTVEHGIVYIDSVNGSIKALRASDGVLLWQYQSGASTLWPAVVQGSVVYVDAKDGTLRALRMSDGSLLHDYKRLGIVTSQPVVQAGSIYINTSDGSLEAISISDDTLSWRYTPSSVIFWPPQVMAGVVYVTSPAGPDLQNKTILAIQASTGNHLWQHQVQNVAYLLLNPTRTGGIAYIGLSGTAMDVLNISNGVLLWHYQSPSPFLLTTVGPVVYANLANGTVNALQATDGFLLWNFPLGIRSTYG